jgi:hypothetical protein
VSTTILSLMPCLPFSVLGLTIGFANYLSLPSHVNKTAEIKSFTILESEGIAKGVRRLTAVTGPEADESILLGQEWTKRTDAMEKLQGKDAEIALKSFPTVRSTDTHPSPFPILARSRSVQSIEAMLMPFQLLFFDMVCSRL